METKLTREYAEKLATNYASQQIFAEGYMKAIEETNAKVGGFGKVKN